MAAGDRAPRLADRHGRPLSDERDGIPERRAPWVREVELLRVWPFGFCRGPLASSRTRVHEGHGHKEQGAKSARISPAAALLPRPRSLARKFIPPNRRGVTQPRTTLCFRVVAARTPCLLFLSRSSSLSLLSPSPFGQASGSSRDCVVDDLGDVRETPSPPRDLRSLSGAVVNFHSLLSISRNCMEGEQIPDDGQDDGCLRTIKWLSEPNVPITFFFIHNRSRSIELEGLHRAAAVK